MEKDKAREWTDNKLEDMEDEISQIYKKSAKGITKKWTKFMSESSDAVSKYQTAYDEAVSGGDKDLIEETSKALQTAIKNQTIGNSYYKGMVDEVTTQLSKVNQTALAYVNNQMPSVYTQNFNFMSTDTKKLVADSGIKFNLVDEAVVKRRVKDGDITLPKKKVDVPKDKRWNTKQLNSSVLQGILQGESMDDISKRILPVVGNNQASAIRNARTMVTGAENQGRLDRYKDLEARGAIIKKVWMATGDARTRDWHLTLDGQEKDLDEDFIDGNGNHLEMPGDAHAPAETVYNCRCTTKSHILGFRKADGSVAMIDYDYSQDEESLHSKEINSEKENRGIKTKTDDAKDSKTSVYDKYKGKTFGDVLSTLDDDTKRKLSTYVYEHKPTSDTAAEYWGNLTRGKIKDEEVENLLKNIVEKNVEESVSDEKLKEEGLKLFRTFVEGGSHTIHEYAGYVGFEEGYDASKVNKEKMKALDSIFKPAEKETKVYKGIPMDEDEILSLDKEINHSLSSTTTSLSTAIDYSEGVEELIPVRMNITIEKDTPIADVQELLGISGMKAYEKEITIGRNTEWIYSNAKKHTDKYGNVYYTVDVIVRKKR